MITKNPMQLKAYIKKKATEKHISAQLVMQKYMLETVLSRNIANTRPRDYYDIYILYALRGAECDKATLRRALERTTEKRGSSKILTQYPEIMQEIRDSDTLRRQWNKYSREYDYAKDISFNDTCNAIQKIMDAVAL